ncbi:Hg(II)-responsive transcriptional regulator [Noviherbaspirillum sp. CPCC 100848]|jgi:MerR family mercuric resistance operon transcriptional regulator|uniref:Mercuric resistance operon regulatory protein n=1 Tax=Noviherbaspirillum album TaxID=3080276 RepID=A0ABU6J4C3_9BURK|nr:Hg(II)-responsive transcriptional regulator [Noviherbaspirillum sp. CPCC 100848]MEC4718293.1 Hg(II)-responsive transcriptional regulator [Noviherbaspirillum sp. CPCC 100848]
MDTKITIGKVAAAADVNVETIRFYQRRGLIAEPPKMLGGFRYYDAGTIERVRFIKRAQTLGFSLEEVHGLLALQQTNACKQTHDAAVLKLQLVEERIKDLSRIRKTLKKLVQQCETGPNTVSCPIIESLSHSLDVGSAATDRDSSAAK